jgi:gluconate 2-dehydrogenase gamma chain
MTGGQTVSGDRLKDGERQVSDTGIDRRQLIHRASMLLGGAVSASAIAGIMAGCSAVPQGQDGAPAAGGFLSPEEMASITAMADHIIPRTDTPGALDAGVPAFIDRMLTGFYPQRERDIVRKGLSQTDADARILRGVAFVRLTADEQIALMRRYDQEQYDYMRANAGKPNLAPHPFRLIKELTLLGFCTSEAGATQLMDYNLNPGPYRGDLPLSEVGKVSAL